MLSSEPAAFVRVSGVSKQFTSHGHTDVPALRDVSVAAGAGEFVCLLGPSGCGKSTLLNIVAGFLPADSGVVEVDGRPVAGPGLDRCMLFQSPTLFPWLSAEENVLFGPRAQRRLAERDMQEKKSRCAELLSIVGLDEFARHYPHQLSGGMQHRVAFARALINEPKVLLMDEPFGALDAITRTAMQDFLLDLWQRLKMTVLFVTHDVEEATLLADRVCVMSARPGQVAKVVSVDIPRPRTFADTETARFIELKREIRAHVRGVAE